jgi:hypothetical protein
MWGSEPLSTNAQIHLTDWILSKPPKPANYFSAFVFLNHRTLHYRQVSDFFHHLASSPRSVLNTYESVVDDLLCLQDNISQLKRGVGLKSEGVSEVSEIAKMTLRK